MTLFMVANAKNKKQYNNPAVRECLTKLWHIRTTEDQADIGNYWVDKIFLFVAWKNTQPYLKMRQRP